MSTTSDFSRSPHLRIRWIAAVPVTAVILSCILPAARLANAQPHTEKKTRIVIKKVDCDFPDSRLQPRIESWVGTFKDLQDEGQKLREKVKNAVPESCRRKLARGSKEAKDCEKTIQSNIQKLSPNITDFNSRVTGFCNSVITTLRGQNLTETRDGTVDTNGLKGKEQRRMAYLTDVPPPFIEREETLEEWVRSNWGKAPEPLRSLLRQALNSPAAMKELIYRRPTEIGDWYRDATKESFAKKLARELTDPDSRWRLAARTWFDDPTHRQWLRDAATIALAPLDAEAFMGARASGQFVIVRYKKSTSVEMSIAQLDAKQAVGDALRQMSEARTSGAYYNFPLFYRGKQPNIPKWLFNENPYAHIYSGKTQWEGTRTAVFMDAEDVWIRRTLESDKALQASDMDFWRAITNQGK